MLISVLALVISVLSLTLSVYTLFITRRDDRLRRLAEIQTKMFSVKLKWQSRIAYLEKAAREPGGIPEIPDSTRAQPVEHSDPNEKEIELLEEKLQSKFLQASKCPFLFRVGVLEGLEHAVDSLVIRVDTTNEQIFHQGDELAQAKKRLHEFRGRQPESEQER